MPAWSRQIWNSKSPSDEVGQEASWCCAKKSTHWHAAYHHEDDFCNDDAACDWLYFYDDAVDDDACDDDYNDDDDDDDAHYVESHNDGTAGGEEGGNEVNLCEKGVGVLDVKIWIFHITLLIFFCDKLTNCQIFDTQKCDQLFLIYGLIHLEPTQEASLSLLTGKPKHPA